MQVLRLHAAGDVRSHQEPDPVPGEGEVLVRVTAVGLCGSDRHWYAEGGTGSASLTQPLVLGHELGGIILDGPGAGERVAVEPARPCGHCAPCLSGDANLCPNVLFLGHGLVDGGLRTLLAWPRRLLVPVPDVIADDDVPLLEALGVGLHAMDLGHVRRGMSAGVYGCGPIGLLLIRALRAVGLGPILATDALPHRVAAALDSGATEARLVGQDGLPDGLSTWGPVDVAFEVAGEDGALETAIRTARIGGRVVVAGIPSTPRSTFPATPARSKGLTIAMSRRMKARHMGRAIELVESGVVDLGGLITARYELAEGAQAFQALVDRTGLKIVVKPSH